MVPRCKEYIIRECKTCGAPKRFPCGRVLTTDGECENFANHVVVTIKEEKSDG